jgi:hypothetical protein
VAADEERLALTKQALMQDYDWLAVFEYARDFGIQDVAEVLGAQEGYNDGDEWIVWGRLNDGRWFYLHAGCDYTGWDCQAAGDSSLADTEEEIIRMGMDFGARQRFGIPQPAPE